MPPQPCIDVLLIEEDESDYLLMRELISELSNYSCRLDWVSNAEGGLEGLLSGRYAIYLIGYAVDAVGGRDLLKRAREAGFQGPCIMLASQADYVSDGRQVLEQDHDCLIKEQLNPFQLERAFRYAFELHRSRHLLLESEATNRVLFEKNPSPACIYDSHTGRFLAVNRAAQACYGHSEAELLCMTIPEVFPADDGSEFAQRSAVDSDGFVDLGEWPQRRANGDEIRVVIRQCALVHAGRPAKLLLLEDVTEQRRQERAFDEYRQLARQLYDRLPSGIWLADENARLIEGNATACRLFGVSEAPAFESLELHVADGRKRLSVQDWSLPRALTSGQVEFDDALIVKTGDGAQQTLISYSLPLSYPGKGVAAAWICFDISALQQAAHDRAELIAILSRLAIGIVVLGGDGTVYFANDAAARFLDGNQATVSLHACIDEAPGERTVDRVDQQGMARRWRVTTVPVDWRGVPARLCTLHDMTQVHATERRLRLYERIAEVCVNGIAIADCALPDWPIVHVNPAFESMTGYRLDEVVGRNCRFLQKDDHDQPNLRLIRQALQERRAGKALLRNYRKDDTLFWNELRVAPVFDADGGMTHYVGILDDVSEYKRYKQELARLANHDRLTGLPNRALFETRLNQALLFAERFRKRVVVLYVNLDRFSEINKAFGHEAGSRLIKLVADRMSAAIGIQDTLARLDGVEFVALRIIDAGASVMDAANGLRGAIGAPIDFEARTLALTCSAGLSQYPEQGSDARQLVHAAYLAMCEASEQGGDGLRTS